MHVKEITVERLLNTGNYENERVAVTIALDKSESPAQAVARGRRFVNSQLGLDDDKPDTKAIKDAKNVLRRAGKLPVEESEF